MREQLALTGQFAAVDELLTGRENLEMFGRLFRLSRADARRRASELLERFELDDAADRTAKTYSGGMRRRLDLASSLLTQPRVLFLDEPTTGLDPRSRNEIWEIVRDLRREGTTILLTTQYLEEADQLADEIAVIDHGRVIAEGTGNELKDRVGGQILEVELTDVRQRDEAEAALLRVGCGAPEEDERPNRLTLPAPRESLVLVEEAAAELRRAGIGVSDMGLRRPTLDDVFLQLTGQAPSENGRPQSAAAVPTRRPVERPRRLPRPHAPSLRDAETSVTDIAVVTMRNLRHFWRQPDLLVFSTIQPIMFVVLFVYVFGGAVGLALPPGVTLRRLPPAGDLRPVGDVPRVEHGGRPLRGPTPRRHRPLPLDADGALGGPARANDRGPGAKRPDHRPDDRRRLPGRLPLPGGRHPGARRASPSSPPSGSPSAGSSPSSRWSSAVPRPRRRPGSCCCFRSSSPARSSSRSRRMPSWLQPIAEASPVTLTADAARTLALTGGVPDSLGGSLAWIVGIVAVFVPLSVWRYRRMS